MKYSKFNTVVNKGDDLLIYNSLSGALLKICRDNIKESKNDLIQKGIIVEDSKDENLLYKYIYYHKIFSNKNLRITIAPTTDCNLHCPYCFEEGNKHKEYIDDIVLDSTLKYITSKKERKIHLTWFGGEPLLCLDKMVELTEKLTFNNVKFTASIITNGTLLNGFTIKQLNKLNLTDIQITLDGEKEKHDKIRFFSNQKGTFDLIMSNINKLLEDNTSVEIILKINIRQENISSSIELFSLLKNKYKSYLHSGKLRLESNYVRNITNFDGCKECLTEDEYLKFYTEIEHKCISIPYLRFPCPLRTQSDIIIGPDGSIYKCLEFIGDKSKSIGNIKNLSISLSRLAEYALTYDPFEDEECKNCSILPICGGGCPNDRLRKAVGEKISICPSIKKTLPTVIENMFNK